MALRNNSGYDLNILPYLLVLLEKKHVSNAAEALGVSQPAMSKALDRARKIFNDKLLIRDSSGQRGFRLTAFGMTLLQTLQQQLVPLLCINASNTFQPEKDVRTFSIGLSDLEMVEFMPLLASVVLHEQFQNLSLNLLPVNSRTLPRLFSNEIDVAFWLSSLPEGVDSRCLARHKVTCLIARDHPFEKDQFNLEEYVRYQHIRTAHPGMVPNFIDTALQEYGLHRRIGIVTHSYYASACLASRTQFIASIPSKAAKALAAITDTRLIEAPKEIPQVNSYLIWNPLLNNDKGLRWLVEIISEQLTQTQDSTLQFEGI